MIANVWNRMWEMHYETKALFSFTPKSVKDVLKGKMFFGKDDIEHDVDLADEMDDAPAEHNQRLKTTPGGVNEEDPKEYTKRQKIGLVLSLFFLSLCL